MELIMIKNLQVKTPDAAKVRVCSTLLGVSMNVAHTLVLTMCSYHIACLVLDALSLTHLQTHEDLSRFHRARRDQQTPQKHREARSARAEGGGGVDITTLPDNVTHVVVRHTYQAFSYSTYTVNQDGSYRIIAFYKSRVLKFSNNYTKVIKIKIKSLKWEETQIHMQMW